MQRKIIVLAALFLCLCATAMAQKITVESSAIDVGQVLYSRPTTATFHLKNAGKKPLVIAKVDTGCGCTAADYPHGAISAGEKFDVKVTYDARQMGHFDRVIEIWSVGAETTTLLELSGVVVAEVDDYATRYPFSLGALAADCNAVGFDDVYLGEVVTQKFHIYNPTSKTAQPQLLHLPSYLTASVLPATVPARGSAEVSLTLDSHSLRDYGHEKTHIYLAATLGEKVSADKRINVGITLLPPAQTLSAAERAAAPSLALSADKVALPRTSSKKSATIELQNVGNGRLTIYDISILAEGYQISLNKKNLAAGEKGRLKITTDPKRLKEDATATRIVLITNDPTQPKVSIVVSAE